MAEDIKKNEELKDEDLDFVAGGKIPPEEWNKYSVEEQNRIRNESIRLITAGKASECRLV